MRVFNIALAVIFLAMAVAYSIGSFVGEYPTFTDDQTVASLCRTKALVYALIAERFISWKS